MEGRKPAGLLVVMTDAKSPAHEEAFNHWYDNVHIPEILDTGIYYAAHRFVHITPTAKPGDPKYLAVYETDWDDPMAAMEEMGKSGDKRTRFPDMERRFRGVFKYIGPGSRTAPGPGNGAGKTPTGLLVVMTTCKNPAHEGEFNTWYNEIHVPDLIKTKAYYAANRYQNMDPGPGDSRYLALYETDFEDPNEAFIEMRKSTPNMYIFEDLESNFRKTFKYLGSKRRLRSGAPSKR